MTEPVCTCPKTYDDNGVLQRAYLDARCPVHARETAAHCPSCTCGVPIVQTPEVARALVEQQPEKPVGDK